MSASRKPSDAIIVGAGPSGLAAAFCLKQAGINYIVLEGSRRVANSWHFVWPNFQFAQTVSEISMPGLDLKSFNPDHHLKRDEIIAIFENYKKQYDLNIEFNIRVIAVKKDQNGIYHASTSQGEYTAKNIILSVGARQEPKFPNFLGSKEGILTDKITHSAWYQGAHSFPLNSKILVVGSGRSAVEIAKDVACQAESKHEVSIACRYNDSQIRENNRHLSSTPITLDDLAKMQIKNVGELCDLNKENYDLIFRNRQAINVSCFFKIICATGYNTSYALLHQLLNGEVPAQKNGITTEAGLYMVGIPAAEEKTVTITKGAAEAENIARHIVETVSPKLPLQVFSPETRKGSLKNNSLFAASKNPDTPAEQAKNVSTAAPSLNTAG